jgi:hypothetical protein
MLFSTVEVMSKTREREQSVHFQKSLNTEFRFQSLLLRIMVIATAMGGVLSVIAIPLGASLLDSEKIIVSTRDDDQNLLELLDSDRALSAVLERCETACRLPTELSEELFAFLSSRRGNVSNSVRPEALMNYQEAASVQLVVYGIDPISESQGMYFLITPDIQDPPNGKTISGAHIRISEARNPRWSCDGNIIVFQGIKNLQADIMMFLNQQFIQITRTDGQERNPIISCDASYLVFISPKDNGEELRGLSFPFDGETISLSSSYPVISQVIFDEENRVIYFLAGKESKKLVAVQLDDEGNPVSERVLTDGVVSYAPLLSLVNETRVQQ